MKQISSLIVALAVLLILPDLAGAQGSISVVRNGNTDIVFENAGTTNLNIPLLKDFDNFAASHPDVASSLSRNPNLVSSGTYLSAHPELAQFVNTHPNFSDDFERNPGNYIHPAPGVETRVEARHNY